MTRGAVSPAVEAPAATAVATALIACRKGMSASLIIKPLRRTFSPVLPGRAGAARSSPSAATMPLVIAEAMVGSTAEADTCDEIAAANPLSVGNCWIIPCLQTSLRSQGALNRDSDPFYSNRAEFTRIAKRLSLDTCVPQSETGGTQGLRPPIGHLIS